MKEGGTYHCSQFGKLGHDDENPVREWLHDEVGGSAVDIGRRGADFVRVVCQVVARGGHLHSWARDGRFGCDHFFSCVLMPCKQLLRPLSYAGFRRKHLYFQPEDHPDQHLAMKDPLLQVHDVACMKRR